MSTGFAFISIDAATALGWAVWESNGSHKSMPAGTGCIVPPRNMTWHTKTIYMAKGLHATIGFWKQQFARVNNRLTVAVLEYPKYFEGHASAATGDLVKLAWAGGRIDEACRWAGLETVLMPVEWKGQLSKDTVIRRLERFYGPTIRSAVKGSHAWDAVGIGLMYKGYDIGKF